MRGTKFIWSGAAVVALWGCAVPVEGSNAGEAKGEPTASTSEALETDNGAGGLTKAIGSCSGQFAICGSWLAFYEGQVSIHIGFAHVTKYQVKLWDGTAAWNGAPLFQSDNILSCQSTAGCLLAGFKPGHSYTAVIQACTQNWDNSYDCGVGSVQGWAQATIKAPNFEWSVGFDATDPTITPGGTDIDGAHLAICQAYYQNGVHPGKARYFGGTLQCDIGWGGHEVFISQLAPPYGWVPNQWGFRVLFTSPSASGSWAGAQYVNWSQAFVGGTDYTDSSNLYVCRVWRPDGSRQLGKVIYGQRGPCNYGFGNHEQQAAYPNYDVFVGPVIPTE